MSSNSRSVCFSPLCAMAASVIALYASSPNVLMYHFRYVSSWRSWRKLCVPHWANTLPKSYRSQYELCCVWKWPHIRRVSHLPPSATLSTHFTPSRQKMSIFTTASSCFSICFRRGMTRFLPFARLEGLGAAGLIRPHRAHHRHPLSNKFRDLRLLPEHFATSPFFLICQKK